MMKEPFGFLRKKQRTPAPPAAFDLTPPDEGKERQGSFNKTAVIAVVVFTVLAAVVYYGVVRRGNRGGAAKPSSNDDERLMRETARYEAEKKAYEEQRQALVDQYERLKAERSEVMRLLQANHEKAARNGEDYQEMFAESKGEHANSDGADSIQTVFMLKDEMDNKKRQLLDTNKALSEEKHRLVQALQRLTQEGNEVTNMHNETFQEEKPLAKF